MTVLKKQAILTTFVTKISKEEHEQVDAKEIESLRYSIIKSQVISKKKAYESILTMHI